MGCMQSRTGFDVISLELLLTRWLGLLLVWGLCNTKDPSEWTPRLSIKVALQTINGMTALRRLRFLAFCMIIHGKLSTGTDAWRCR